MSCLALCDFKSPTFVSKALSLIPHLRPTSPHPNAGACLASGSLVVEVLVAGSASEVFLPIDLPPSGADKNRFSIRMDPLGTTLLTLTTAQGETQVAVKSGTSFVDRRLRLTYSWDPLENRGLLTLENLEDGRLAQTEFANPQPMPLALIQRLTSEDTLRTAPETDFFSFSDQIEPVGLTMSLARGTPIATPRGYVNINTLCTGDLVFTRDNGAQPIRWIGSRTVPAKGGFQPIRLHAPYFGLTRDLLVAPEQRIMVGGASIEYLFGKAELLVEARQLINGHTAVLESSLRSLTYYQILLDNHEILDVAGASLESLYAGEIRDDPGLMRTTLLGNKSPDNIPVHGQVARPLLRSYEATTLRSVLMS